MLDAIAREVPRAFVAEFAEEARYTPAGGVERRVSLVFDHEADPQDIGEMVQMDGRAAVAMMQTVAIPEMAIHDAMTVRGQVYKVVGVEPDGTGVTRVILGI